MVTTIQSNDLAMNSNPVAYRSTTLKAQIKSIIYLFFLTIFYDCVSYHISNFLIIFESLNEPLNFTSYNCCIKILKKFNNIELRN
ncbi:hypothetical protein BpHYR1_005293 [Brachionus plicatilis]|uniref:Uncharacterized protein n=1 Tax=Brachionus plicatilis TaxID=10195 RepID=A0A3M7S666_BRAPC|nr:hypothetical protein BpHYR1_005293 [Brachionus plicatilis]